MSDFKNFWSDDLIQKIHRMGINNICSGKIILSEDKMMSAWFTTLTIGEFIKDDYNFNYLTILQHTVNVLPVKRCKKRRACKCEGINGIFHKGYTLYDSQEFICEECYKLALSEKNVLKISNNNVVTFYFDEGASFINYFIEGGLISICSVDQLWCQDGQTLVIYDQYYGAPAARYIEDFEIGDETLSQPNLITLKDINIELFKLYYLHHFFLIKQLDVDSNCRDIVNVINLLHIELCI